MVSTSVSLSVNVENSIAHSNSGYEAPNWSSSYVMIDGAMYPTREEGWKEAKLARVFKGSDNILISRNCGMITDSEYVAHLGSIEGFFSKLEYHIGNLQSLCLQKPYIFHLNPLTRKIHHFSDD